MYRLTVTSYSDAVPAGGVAQAVMVVPNGYGKLIKLLFNPSIAYDINMLSQKTKVALLDGFRTSIGTFGFLDLPSTVIENDRYIIKFTNRTGAIQDLFITAIFQAGN